MGSGLILLVIVAAWLAVLVPMALRSHESSTSLSSVDRFSDAMRVLSRRDAAARARARAEADDDPLSAQAYADNDDDWDDDWDDELAPAGWRERLGGWRERAAGWRARAAGLLPGARPGPRSSSPAARRRRLLITLVALLVVTTAGGLLGPRVLLAVAGVLAVAVVLFVVQLRRLAVARATRQRRAARAAARSVAPLEARPAPVRRPTPPRPGSVRVSPVDVPAAPEPVAAPLARAVGSTEVFDGQAEPVAAPAVRYDEPLPAAAPVAEPDVWVAPAAALGGAWSPVPVPPPTYVTAPVARARRVVDLTRPGAWTPQQTSRPAEELPGTAPVAAPVNRPAAERRRAVNDW